MFLVRNIIEQAVRRGISRYLDEGYTEIRPPDPDPEALLEICLATVSLQSKPLNEKLPLPRALQIRIDHAGANMLHGVFYSTNGIITIENLRLHLSHNHDPEEEAEEDLTFDMDEDLGQSLLSASASMLSQLLESSLQFTAATAATCSIDDSLSGWIDEIQVRIPKLTIDYSGARYEAPVALRFRAHDLVCQKRGSEIAMASFFLRGEEVERKHVVGKELNIVMDVPNKELDVECKDLWIGSSIKELSTLREAQTDQTDTVFVENPIARITSIDWNVRMNIESFAYEKTLAISQLHAILEDGTPHVSASMVSWVDWGCATEISLALSEPEILEEEPSDDSVAGVSCSPFDDDRLLFFRTARKPNPIASPSQTKRYKQTERLRGRGHCIVSIGVLQVLPNLKPHIEELLLSTNDNSDETPLNIPQFELSLEVNVVLLKASFGNAIIEVECPSAFINASMETWSMSIDRVAVDHHQIRSSRGSITHIRVAGELLSRVSVDVRSALISHIDPLLQELPTLPEAESTTDFLIRVAQVRAQGCFNTPFPIKAEQLEVFSTPKNDIIVTALKCKVGCLQANTTQLRLIQSPEPSWKINISSLNGIITPEDLRPWLLQDSTESVETSQAKAAEEPFLIRPENIVRHYIATRAIGRRAVPNAASRVLWAITVEKAHIRLALPQRTAHVDFIITRCKTKKRTNQELTVEAETLTCFDRIEDSVWNKAIIAREVAIAASKDDDIRIHVSRSSELVASIDQKLIDFLGEWANQIGAEDNIEPKDPSEDRRILNSIHIDAFKARVDYKPGGSKDTDTPGWLRFMPLRSAQLLVPKFELFDIHSWGDVGTTFALHAIRANGNLTRLVSSLKPLKAPADIFSHASELVLIPVSGRGAPNLNAVIKQAKHAAKRTAISVLELGPTVHLRPIRPGPQPSVHSNQPDGIKRGFIRAGETLRDDMGTIVAFIRGDIRNVDLFDLPIMIVRPLTSPLANIINGLCNQMDRKRYLRLRDKYR